ncbi:hypothetical protein K469DRAFT_154994 [Zopfia rhizophila CBS 207.26]|uniref:Secreted protein n=1 Tax=Zopfia rhizophila CBS 207.26 TaxID=1314779 RepID=A0A6A6E196_9PEZI|nr:hypothetical protein K469DRAFT_154994 [Zopfia rhizophila CBS 207.26]
MRSAKPAFWHLLILLHFGLMPRMLNILRVSLCWVLEGQALMVGRITNVEGTGIFFWISPLTSFGNWDSLRRGSICVDGVMEFCSQRKRQPHFWVFFCNATLLCITLLFSCPQGYDLHRDKQLYLLE